MSGSKVGISRRALQIVTAALALIPLVTGAVGWVFGLRDPLYLAFGVVPNAVLDSNLRFFSGVWLGLGVAMVSMVRHIERHGPLFRAVWGMIFVGGLGRILSAWAAGAPPAPFWGATALELFGAPLFVLWQRRVERATRAP